MLQGKGFTVIQGDEENGYFTGTSTESSRMIQLSKRAFFSH